MEQTNRLTTDRVREAVYRALGRGVCHMDPLGAKERLLLLAMLHAAKFPDLSQAADAKKVAAMVGLTPRTVRRVLLRIEQAVAKADEGE